jgi:hypothetical protein
MGASRARDRRRGQADALQRRPAELRSYRWVEGSARKKGNPLAPPRSPRANVGGPYRRERGRSLPIRTPSGARLGVGRGNRRVLTTLNARQLSRGQVSLR